MKKRIKLDTKITPLLREEGIVREIVRQIQDLRKKANFVPKNKSKIYFSTLDFGLEKILFKNKEIILKETNSQIFEHCQDWKDFKGQFGEIKVEEKSLCLGILPF